MKEDLYALNVYGFSEAYVSLGEFSGVVIFTEDSNVNMDGFIIDY